MSDLPFLPFTRPQLDEDTIAGVVEVLRSGWLTSGPNVLKFEAALSDYFGGRPVRCFNSGTCTMEIALRLCGIGAGDEVITTPLSWVATSNVILEVGARPVFVDVDPVTRNIDLGRIEAAITPRTKALMPVYLAGLPVDMDSLYALAHKHKLRVIEDSAQAIGSRWQGKAIGSFGDFASFSFHANKNITTSEGGCLVLPDASLLPLAEKLRLQGVTRSGVDGMDVDVLGGKFNLTDIAARIGLGQLAQLDTFTQRRRQLAQRYFTLFDQAGALAAQLPPRDFENSNWHMFQLVLPENGIARADFITAMKARNIGVGVHYPPIHLFSLYRALGFAPGDFPVAESIGRGIVTLPLFPAMQDADVDRVVQATLEVLQGK
ncbi:MAG: DegT/DnrJ/EryC1/StrS aminotransferase family protein [Burkholderiaceae bacterium]|nr:MAG: DegT/DnrJ/EryC1/StrS aminotransferase family protein [Burkholderiaceae bacterium]